jgi:hypothetical protein
MRTTGSLRKYHIARWLMALMHAHDARKMIAGPQALRSRSEALVLMLKLMLKRTDASCEDPSSN